MNFNLCITAYNINIKSDEVQILISNRINLIFQLISINKFFI